MLKIPLVNGYKLFVNSNYSPIKNLKKNKENTIIQLINDNSNNHCSLLCFKIIEYAFANKNINVSIKDMKNYFSKVYNKFPNTFLTEKKKEPFKNALSLKQTIGTCINSNKNLFTKTKTGGKETFFVNINSHVINYLKDLLENNEEGLSSERKIRKKEFIKRKNKNGKNNIDSIKNYNSRNFVKEGKSLDFDSNFFF